MIMNYTATRPYQALQQPQQALQQHHYQNFIFNNNTTP